MRPSSGRQCAVCGAGDERALENIVLAGGVRTTLCGSHALMYRRSKRAQRSESELRALFRDRRERTERRREGDELGMSLTAAFAEERRAADRRRV
jgi:hypothetical protein